MPHGRNPKKEERMKISFRDIVVAIYKVRFFKRAGVCLFLILCLGQGICVHAKEAVFEKDGEVYLIQSEIDMRTLALLVNRGAEVEPGVAAHNASYRLTRDIDLSAYCAGGEGWEPIGYRDIYNDGTDQIPLAKRGQPGGGKMDRVTYKETDAGYFNGTFDGGGHIITGLYINRPKEQAQGLFGARMDLRGKDRDSVAYKSRELTVIKNLYVKDCDVAGAYNTGGIMGGMWNFIQYEGGELHIENCHVTGKIVSDSCAGGIVGSASVVKNSSFTGTVEASGAGGIAGEAYYIYGCAVHATVDGYSDVGGIGGTAVCVRNSYMTGSVAGYDSVGGITGRGACLTGCYTRADVTGFSRTGGLIGDIQTMNAPRPEGSCNKATIQNCLMGGYRMEREEEEDDSGIYYPADHHYNGCIYGFPGVGIDDRATSAFYYRQGLVTEGFGKGMYTFSTWNCKPYDCAHLEETDFKDLLGRPEETWGDVWFCAADYAWPTLSWEKESRFGYTVTVTVQKGDSLWEIAGAVCGDGHFWTRIYEENQERIGQAACVITAGTDLEVIVNASQADYAAGGDIWRQEKTFLEKGEEQGIAEAELRRFYRRLLADDLWNGAVWEERNRRLNDWVIADLDGNGQTDMLVMAGEGGVFVPGEIWLYFNGEPAYTLKDESDYYEEFLCFGSSFWEGPVVEDVDNDGRLELLFAVGNGGNGGPGGRDTCLFRRVGNVWEECLEELPNDREEGGETGLHIDVTCIGANRYEAYCPYLGESVEFDGQNSREIAESEFGRAGGGNVRGFYAFKCVQYEGKNALQCREYLSGEGGNAHGVGAAVFLLVWDADGVCRVADWWVET